MKEDKLIFYTLEITTNANELDDILAHLETIQTLLESYQKEAKIGTGTSGQGYTSKSNYEYRLNIK